MPMELVIEPLLLLRRPIVCQGLLNPGLLRRLGDRHVPPTLEAGHPRLGVYPDVDDRRSVGRDGLRQRLTEGRLVGRTEGERTETGGVGGEVDRDEGAVEAV